MPYEARLSITWLGPISWSWRMQEATVSSFFVWFSANVISEDPVDGQAADLVLDNLPDTPLSGSYFSPDTLDDTISMGSPDSVIPGRQDGSARLCVAARNAVALLTMPLRSLTVCG